MQTNPFRPFDVRHISKLSALALSLAMLLSQNALAKPGEWVVDEQASSIRFTVKHLMFSNVQGRFTKFGGEVSYDGTDLAKAKVVATIEGNSIDTKNKLRDNHLRGDDILDVRKHPQFKFVSKQISPHADGSFDIVGDFEMHGIIKPVTLAASPLGQPEVDAAGKKHIVAKAKTVIDRKSFDVFVDRLTDKGGRIVGDQVNVELNINLVEKNG